MGTYTREYLRIFSNKKITSNNIMDTVSVTITDHTLPAPVASKIEISIRHGNRFKFTREFER